MSLEEETETPVQEENTSNPFGETFSLEQEHNMIPFIGPLISAVSSIGGSWMENKLQETKANSQVKIAKAEAEAEVHKKVATGEIEWEKTMAISASFGIKGFSKFLGKQFIDTVVVVFG